MSADVLEFLASVHAADEQAARAAAAAGANNVYPSAPGETAEWEWSGENIVSPHGVVLANGPYGMGS